MEKMKDFRYVNAAHFKPQAHGLVSPGLFRAFFRGNARESGQQRVAGGVDKDAGRDLCQSLDGLHDAGGDPAAFRDRADESRVVKDFCARFLAHLVIDES